MKIELQYFEGCPGHQPSVQLLNNVLGELLPGTTFVQINVTTLEIARQVRFRGSPSIVIDGRDIEDRKDSVDDMCCRVYDGKPLPERWLLEAAIIRALKPKKFLFMCVQNSARSQLAEAISRHLAPEGVDVLSAGSKPAFLRPQAVQVLEEAGIPVDGLYSKAVDDVDTTGVEVVVTLCADEVCPVYLGKAHRLHWGLGDPAKVEPEKEKLDAFRATRDELIKRLKVLLAYTPE